MQLPLLAKAEFVNYCIFFICAAVVTTIFFGASSSNSDSHLNIKCIDYEQVSINTPDGIKMNDLLKANYKQMTTSKAKWDIEENRYEHEIKKINNLRDRNAIKAEKYRVDRIHAARKATYNADQKFFEDQKKKIQLQYSPRVKKTTLRYIKQFCITNKIDYVLNIEEKFEHKNVIFILDPKNNITNSVVEYIGNQSK